jgi:hypothetical protein
MELQKKQGKSVIRIILIVVLLALLGAAVWFTFTREKRGSFCFDFSHDMQFGDGQVIKNPVNEGRVMLNGTYYLPEVPALQEALTRQGLYIDPFENTGGKIYAASFFGPSTRVAVMAFQKKNGLPQTGQVNNETIDRLSKLYKCPPSRSVATTTIVTVSTTTPKK